MSIRIQHLPPNQARFVRALPGGFIALLGVLGLLFPNLISWYQDEPSTTSGKREKSKVVHIPNGYQWLVIILGGLGVAGAFIKELTEPVSDAGHLGEEEFITLYTDAISTTLEVLPYIGVYDQGEKQKYMTNLLQNICTVAEAYKNDTKSTRHYLNACLYVPVEPKAITLAQRKSASLFMDQGRNSYNMFLVLKLWARDSVGGSRGRKGVKPCVSIDFTLPVDYDPNFTLFGAPTAFLEAEPNDVSDISNRRAISLLPGTNYPPTHKNIVRFFEDRSSYLSFVSIPITSPSGTLGVVSLQSKRKHFCSVTNDEDRKMLVALKPFISALRTVMSYPETVI